MKLIIILFYSMLFGDISDYFITENQFELKTKEISFKDSTYFNDLNKSFNQILYKNKTDFIYNQFKTSWEINLYRNSEIFSAEEVYYQYSKQDKQNFTIKKLYIQYTQPFDDFEISVAAGVIPFNGGQIKQYSYQNQVDGNGLFTLINISLVGYWVNYTNNDNDIFIIAGQGYWSKDNFYNNYDIPDNFNNSSGMYNSSGYNIENLSSLQHIQLDIYNTEIYQDKIFETTNMIYGLGYSYESFSQGLVFYTILSYNINTLKMGHHENNQNNDNHNDSESDSNIHNDDNNNNSSHNTNTHNTNTITSGGSTLFGIKKYFEIYSKECDIGFEYFRTYDAFFSANVGNLYNNDYSSAGSPTLSYKIYSDLTVNKDVIFNIGIVKKTFNKESISYKIIYSFQTGVQYRF